ncbi:MAG: hypothetical protein D6706_06075 [Chloroflexi bacterium]|nr:MAG: hypothetical protein D6706_06075 [Chloroflexota bacterium]
MRLYMLLWGAGAWYVVVMFTSNIWYGLLGALPVVAVVWAAYSDKKDMICKQFYVPPVVANKVVRTVLDEKGVPYTPRGYVLYLADDMQIIIESTTHRGLGQIATVWIGPETPETLPMIRSLRRKLDEAFLPRGLR